MITTAAGFKSPRLKVAELLGEAGREAATGGATSRLDNDINSYNFRVMR
jgi:hypothetical protein